MIKTGYADFKAGRRLLRTLLPRAQKLHAEAKDDAKKWVAGTPLGRSFGTVLRLENLDAIIIHEGELGGWITDFYFKDVPLGVSNVIGTPVETPMPTRKMAQDKAVEMLHALIIATEQAAGQTTTPVFLFHGFAVELSPDALEFVANLGAKYSSEEAAVEHIEAMTRRVFPSGIPQELYLCGDTLADFMTVIHMAALTGLIRYPLREARTLTGHEEQKTQH